MYTNIYEALRSGRTSEDLVKDFTNAMNEAEERVRREDEEAAAAEAAKATAANEKRTAFANAIKSTFDAISTYYPQYAEELTEEDYLGLADLVISLLDLEAVKYTVKPRVVKKKKPVARSSDDVFEDFFKSLGF